MNTRIIIIGGGIVLIGGAIFYYFSSKKKIEELQKTENPAPPKRPFMSVAVRRDIGKIPIAAIDIPKKKFA